MKRCSASVALVVCLVAPAPDVQAQKPAEDPVIAIDGAKNPELIPEWAVWLEAFRFMAGPDVHDLPIPTPVYRLTSPEQRTFIRKEALGVMAREDDLAARGAKLRDGLTPENTPERSEQADAFEMQRRRAALQARDRVLEAVSPEAQAALREFAERLRRGFTVHILKSKLAQYHLPE
jgi:hypothetical protein